MIRPKLTPVVAVLAAALFAPAAAPAQAADPDRATVFGVRLRLGARHDDVRMCVATPAGVKGGFAADVSLFADLPIGDRASVDLNLPVVRPILFAAAFRMLQLEPEATLLFRGEASDGLDFVGGPSLGLSLHYGPDYNSPPSARGPAFFALGPSIGAYLGVEFKRDDGLDFGLGVHPYATPLFDADRYRGRVLGAMLDGSLWFDGN